MSVSCKIRDSLNSVSTIDSSALSRSLPQSTFHTHPNQLNSVRTETLHLVVLCFFLLLTFPILLYFSLSILFRNVLSSLSFTLFSHYIFIFREFFFSFWWLISNLRRKHWQCLKITIIVIFIIKMSMLT